VRPAATVGWVWMTWREAMRTALYGPAGFYARGEAPARHFHTSAHASNAYAGAMLSLLREVDAALGHPRRLDLVDVGAGRGELLGQVLNEASRDPGLAARIAARAVEITPRPDGLDPRIRWQASPPAAITGLVIASEWLDNIPLDVAELTAAGPRLVLVETRSGAERPGPPLPPADLAWSRAWWPLAAPGDRAEIGKTRCQAWAGVIRRITRGLAVAADYGHQRSGRPGPGTLTGYRDGRMVRAIPDGSCDITAHVALDACADAGRAARAGSVPHADPLTPGRRAAAGGRAACAAVTVLTTQRQALRAFGVMGRRPPLAQAGNDPLGYARALSQASEEAELIDAQGLGAFGWLAQAVGIDLPAKLAALGQPPA
jgi:SAM-dependent MidA family methyltransferase